MGYAHGFRWTYEEAKNSVKKCIDILELNRMPTHKVLNSFYGNCGLSLKLSRECEWKSRIMEELKLELKENNTSKGKKYEVIAENILFQKGFEVERMATGQHFDLLINNSVKVDVKCAKRWYTNSYQVNSFGINKKFATCDVYMLIALDDDDEIERIMIVPSYLLRNVTTMSIGKKSKYDCWIERYDIIEKYSHFLGDVLN